MKRAVFFAVALASVTAVAHAWAQTRDQSTVQIAAASSGAPAGLTAAEQKRYKKALAKGRSECFALSWAKKEKKKDRAQKC